jgi:hypothetical protein
MASSEVDQKALGFWSTSEEAIHKAHDPGIGESGQIESAILVNWSQAIGISAMLYKVLGVSVMLSKKLLRARKLRRLDTTRETL